MVGDNKKIVFTIQPSFAVLDQHGGPLPWIGPGTVDEERVGEKHGRGETLKCKPPAVRVCQRTGFSGTEQKGAFGG